MSVASDSSAPRPLNRFFGFWRSAYRLADWLAPIGDLLLRIWVAKAFWDSGLSKIQSFETTVQLFTYEYQVPLLPPNVAAAMAVGGELILPVLLVTGIFGRIAAAGLFILNCVAVISYPALEPAGLAMHLIWGLVLLTLVLRGPGILSIDHFVSKRFRLK